MVLPKGNVITTNLLADAISQRGVGDVDGRGGRAGPVNNLDFGDALADVGEIESVHGSSLAPAARVQKIQRGARTNAKTQGQKSRCAGARHEKTMWMRCRMPGRQRGCPNRWW
jgi:hypothetical protein